MAYITPAYITERYLNQLGGNYDQTLQTMIENAESLVNQVLGFAFAEYSLTATVKPYRWYASDRVYLPAHKAGSVGAVVLLDTTTTIDPATFSGETGDIYETCEVNRALYRRAGWSQGRYSVAAIWGPGPVPASVQQVVAELVVNNWRSKDAGRYSAVVGVEGGSAVGYEKALTPQQKLTLDTVRRRYSGGIRV